MWNCFSRDLAGYVRTRFPVWLAVLLSSLISAAAILPTQRPTPLETVAVFLLAMLLVFEFRLGDDLADRVRDQQLHPDRVLCRTSHVSFFRRLLIVVAVINMGIVAGVHPWWSSVVLLLLHALLGLWYWMRDRWPLGLVVNYHVVLLKYPGFVLILGTAAHREFAPPLFISAAVVYLSLCVFEVLHDGQLRKLIAARVLLVVDVALLLVAIFSL